jgi:hypothetical protein
MIIDSEAINTPIFDQAWLKRKRGLDGDRIGKE